MPDILRQLIISKPEMSLERDATKLQGLYYFLVSLTRLSSSGQKCGWDASFLGGHAIGFNFELQRGTWRIRSSDSLLLLHLLPPNQAGREPGQGSCE